MRYATQAAARTARDRFERDYGGEDYTYRLEPAGFAPGWYVAVYSANGVFLTYV